jgi:tape measure domain-containing protein
MEKLQWMFELVDRMSGPAAGIAGAVSRLDNSMQRASGSTRTYERTQANATRTSIRFGSATIPVTRGVARAMDMANRAVSALGNGLRRLGSGAIGVFRSIGSSIGSLITGQLAQMAALFASWRTLTATIGGQLGTMADRVRFVRGFDIMLGAGQGERVMQRIVALSGQLGLNWRDTSTAARELFSKGFGEEQVFRLVQGFADLQSVNPGTDIGRIALAMGQVRQAGRLQGDELNQLAEGGLNLSRVMPRIAEALHIDPTQVRDAMRSGLITADIFEQAVLGAMADQAGGTIGSIAEEMSHTLGGEWDRLRNAPDRFFERVAAGGTESSNRLTASLRRVNEMLEGENGDKIVNLMASAVDGLADAMDWLVANSGTISNVFRGLGFVLTPLIVMFEGLGITASWAATNMGGWSNAIGTAAGMWSEFSVKTDVFLANFTGKFTAFVANVFIIGQNIVRGLVNGMLSMASLPAQTIATMGTGMLSTLRGALGIHSPSAEFAYLGEMVGAGFMQGMNDSGMSTSLDGRIQAPALGSAAQASALMGNTINVTINVAGGDAERGQELAEQIRDALMPQLVGVFDGLALESGV